jgi:hypothetical protein
MSPRGILRWSTEVSVVTREALTEDIRRKTKTVMPEEQIAPGKYRLTVEAAKRSPLIAVASTLTPKLLEQNVRVHTIGVDRTTSSFFYIAEGGGEEPISVAGDLVQAVGETLGDRADNAAIERVMDSIVDRVLRSLSKGRITELGVELAAALPRAANVGGAQEAELDQFEKNLAPLVGSSEKYKKHLQQIADALTSTSERKVDVPLYVDARKVPHGPFELTVGDHKVSLATYEPWVMSGPFTEPTTAAAKPAAAAIPEAATPRATATPSPKPVEAKPAPTPTPTPTPAADQQIKPQTIMGIGMPITEQPAVALPEEKAPGPAAAAPAPAPAQQTVPLGAMFDASVLAVKAAEETQTEAPAAEAPAVAKTLPLSAVYDPKVFEMAKAAEDARRAQEAQAAAYAPPPQAGPPPQAAAMAPPPQAAAPMPMPRQAPRPNLAPPKTNKVAVAAFITVTILALLVLAAVVVKVLSKR